MTTTYKKRSKKAGLPPGALPPVGAQLTERHPIEIMEYQATALERRQVIKLEDCRVTKPAPTVTWINVEGTQTEVLQHFGSCFGIHPLVLEDIATTDQRPKAQDYGSYLYVVLKMLMPDGQGGIRAEQVSLILSDHLVISFQEGLDGDTFDPIRNRLQNEKGHLRQSGADYLLYCLLDVIVDNYFVVLEQIAEQIEEIEDELVQRPTTATVQEIYRLKREMFFLHKAVWPLREVVGGVQRRESQLIRKGTNLYLRDLYDHTVQVLDSLETLRETTSGMLDIYLSSMSNRLNEVMKVLTIIATIFMPLSFIVGLYGMNFKHMPELEWRYGYPAVLIVMAAIAGGMVWYFKKKRWL